MEKVDELIEKLADHIIGIINIGNETDHEIAEKTSALAKLIEVQHERQPSDYYVKTFTDSLSGEELHKIVKEQVEKFKTPSKVCT